MSLLISGCHIGVRPIACWYISMARPYKALLNCMRLSENNWQTVRRIDLIWDWNMSLYIYESFVTFHFLRFFRLPEGFQIKIVHCVTVKTLSTVTSAEKRKWVSSPFFLYHLLDIRYFCYLIKCFEITLWYNERTRLSDERVENDCRRKDSVITILLTMILQSQSKIERS